MLYTGIEKSIKLGNSEKSVHNEILQLNTVYLNLQDMTLTIYETIDSKYSYSI